MKMRELERRTGVHRETIRVYLRKGLVPQPRRPKPNVAHYGEDHVRAIATVRELHAGRGLSLPQIRRALDGDPAALPADAGAFPQLDGLVASRVGFDDSLVPISTLLPRNPSAPADARALHRVGAVRLRRVRGVPHLSRADAQLVALWGGMRAAGFREETGFPPAVVRLYVEAAERLAKTEVATFLARAADALTDAEAARLIERALPDMLSFFGLLRMKAVLAELGRRRA